MSSNVIAASISNAAYHEYHALYVDVRKQLLTLPRIVQDYCEQARQIQDISLTCLTHIKRLNILLHNKPQSSSEHHSYRESPSNILHCFAGLHHLLISKIINELELAIDLLQSAHHESTTQWQRLSAVHAQVCNTVRNNNSSILHNAPDLYITSPSLNQEVSLERQEKQSTQQPSSSPASSSSSSSTAKSASLLSSSSGKKLSAKKQQQKQQYKEQHRQAKREQIDDNLEKYEEDMKIQVSLTEVIYRVEDLVFEYDTHYQRQLTYIKHIQEHLQAHIKNSNITEDMNDSRSSSLIDSFSSLSELPLPTRIPNLQALLTLDNTVSPGF